MLERFVEQAEREHRKNPASVLDGGDGSARFAIEYRRLHGNWEDIPNERERLAAYAAMLDAVAAYRSGRRP